MVTRPRRRSTEASAGGMEPRRVAGWLPPAVVLAIAMSVAVATTDSRVRVAPSYPTLAAGGVLVAAALFAPERLRPLAAILGAAVAGATAGHLLAVPGMPRVHDIGHLWGIWAYGRCVTEGAVYPLWIPYLGAGIPLLQFYGPVSFVLALPGIAAGLPPMDAWKLELFLGHVLSSLSFLSSARMLGAGWRGSLLAGVAGAFAPWRLAVFGYRGALGEANAFLFMPLVASGTLRMARRPTRAMGAILAASVAGLTLTHLPSLFTLIVVLIPALLVQEAADPVRGESRRRRLLALGLAWIAAAGLTAAWWVPLAFETRHTSVEESTKDNPYYRYEEHGARPAALLARRQWDRVRVSIPETKRRAEDLEGQQMPFYTGAVLALMGISAPGWSRRRDTWAPACGGGLALALATVPLAHLAAALPGFAEVRFPWRFLSPASVLACLALGLAAEARDRAAEGWRRALPLLVLLGSLVWDAAPYTGAADRIPPYHGVVHWYTDDPAWVFWETSVKPAPVDWSRERGVVRVRNLELPPSEYTTEIDSFFPAYSEWMTPAIYETYWKSRDPRVLAEAGVKYGFSNTRRVPSVAPARAYATLEMASADPIPIAMDRVRRSPGKVELEAEVPPGGARLVLLEQAFPGWEVRVDGGTSRAPREVRGFLVVDLPEGRHRAQFAYGMRTPPRLAGLAASLASLAICVASGARAMRGLAASPRDRDS